MLPKECGEEVCNKASTRSRRGVERERERGKDCWQENQRKRGVRNGPNRWVISSFRMMVTMLGLDKGQNPASREIKGKGNSVGSNAGQVI